MDTIERPGLGISGVFPVPPGTSDWPLLMAPALPSAGGTGLISRLVPKVPSVRFVAVAGSIYALVLTLFSAFETDASPRDFALWHGVAQRLVVDYLSLLVVLFVLALARWAIPGRLFLDPPALRALAFSFAPYTVAGMVGGVARYHFRLWTGLNWLVDFPWEMLTNMGAGMLSFTMMGFLASQYYPLMERLERLRALSFMAEQAADIAKRRDFGRRLSLTSRLDDVGYLAGTVNHLLETVESTLQSHHDFLADTSHEMRNPLLAMRMNLELMQRVSDPEAREECLKQSIQQVERMSRLVSDLLTLARLESGQIVEGHIVPLRPLVVEMACEAEKQAIGQRIVLGQLVDAEVLGDENRLRQVLTNLVNNALQHTAHEGTVTLSLENQDGWARLEVVDTGEGIPSEHLPHIFKRFYQVGKASSGGVGLGLAIVKHLCEAHGGQVTVESELGRGSCFTCWLPLLRRDEPLGSGLDAGKAEATDRPG